MKKTQKPALDGPLWIVVALALIAAVLGILAYIPTWHGSTRVLLRLSFWAIACLSVIMIPLATRTKKEREEGG